MVDNAIERRTTGNFCLYKTIASRRTPLFLQRNLNAVLDAHDQALKDFDNPLPHGTMLAEEWRRHDWEYPRKEILDDLTFEVKPVLLIDAIELRAVSQRKGVRFVETESRHKPLLDGLPDPDDGLLLPCQIQVAMRPTRASAKDPLLVKKSDASIVQRDNSEEASIFLVKSARPITIELSELTHVTESAVNGQRSWRRGIHDSYHFELSLTFDDSMLSAQFLSTIHGTRADIFRGNLLGQGQVKATWEDLPICPPTGHLLTLKQIIPGMKPSKLRYGMEVTMGWTKKRDSSLVRYNRARSSNVQQLPTPSSSDDLEAGAERSAKMTVRYNRQVGLEILEKNVHSLECIFCASGARDDQAHLYGSKSGALRQPARSLERLIFHYKCFHGYYEWKMGERTREADGSEVISVEILDPEKRPESDAQAAAREREHSWIAPSRPFDLKAYLAGDERWVSGTSGESVKRRGRGHRKDENRGENHVYKAPPIAKTMTPPSEVPDLPEPPHRLNEVPFLPGTTFYHSSSKHPIQPHEILTFKGDRDFENRLMHSHRRDLEAAGFHGEARAFHEAFNQHLSIERHSGQAVIRDACVRFARKHEGLQSEIWQSEFRARLEHLSKHRLLDQDAVDYCLDPKVHEGARRSLASMTEERGQEKKDPLPNDEIPRLNGRFAPTPEGNLNAPGVMTAKSKKSHKWNGGGADKDIIAGGIEDLGSRASNRPSARHSNFHNSPEARMATTGSVALVTERHPEVATNGHAISTADGPMSSGEHRRDEYTIMPDDDAAILRTKDASAPVNHSLTNGSGSEKARQKRVCLCGQRIDRPRGTIACENPHCERGDFHLSCVGLTARVNGWLCEACR